MAGLLGPTRRAAAPDRGGVPRDPDRRAGQPRSPSTAPTPSGWPGCSTSWCWCSSRARASTRPSVARTIDMVREDLRPSEVLNAEVLRSARGRTVRPNTAGQKRYTDAIAANTITFGIGPAGTGKSYLAVALAVQALQSRQVNRIILTRPAVEAGERLGFLPGDLMAKVDPVPAPALRRPLRPAGARGRPAAARPRAPSRWRRWPSCAAARSTPRSSSSTRRRTPRPSR